MGKADATQPLAVWQRPRLDPDGGIGPGVAAGLARELALDPLFVRIAFVVLTIAGGWGVLVYLAAWLLMRSAPTSGYKPVPKAASPALRIFGFVLIVQGLVLASTQVSDTANSALVWPAVLVSVAVAVMWARGGDPRQQISELSQADHLAPRVLVGLGSLLAGVIVALAISLSFWQAVSGIVVAGLIVVGTGVLFAPVVGRLGSDLFEERNRRIRSEERADMAAHLHDSVLQTLTLIQKRSGDAEVVGLARRQERELRSWLFDGQSISPNLGFRAALERELGDVEAMHGVAIELVVVGDAPLDPDVSAVVKAAREAATNAAKHSGVDRVDVFAEVTGVAINCFVRDQGVGFDPEGVDHDRAGIRDSIVARIARHGGSTVVASEPGGGTEVEITLPRAATTSSPTEMVASPGEPTS